MKKFTKKNLTYCIRHFYKVSVVILDTCQQVGCLRDVHYFLFMDTMKGIIWLIPQSLIYFCVL